ncbi:MAG: DUF29 family protein [Cyanobacteria bacterium RI_101]|jgi:hypothetical protein|nr:DUF29 family protein [Cyanobacteria bacterium RI_101]
MTPALYDADFNLWIEETAKSLKAGNFGALDLENLIEEIEAMGRSDKREIKTRLIVLLMHLLKCQYQPQKQTASWIATINEQRRQIKAVLKDSPSLKPYLQQELGDGYEDARKDAAKETGLPVAAFPPECPFTQEQILDPDYFPMA